MQEEGWEKRRRERRGREARGVGQRSGQADRRGEERRGEERKGERVRREKDGDEIRVYFGFDDWRGKEEGIQHEKCFPCLTLPVCRCGIAPAHVASTKRNDRGVMMACSD
eukprot:757677-Hanusia_phi.AAC.1